MQPKILVTRPLPDALSTATMLEDVGYSPVIAPLLETIFEPNPVIDVHGVTAVAFTSRNGVRAASQWVNSDDFKRLRAYCVGAATAHEADQSGFSDIVTANGDVHALARRIEADLGSRTVPEGVQNGILHLTGADRAGDLVAALKEHGIEAKRAILYRAVAASDLQGNAADLLGAGEIDAVLHFSPRTASIFVGLAADIMTKPLINTPCVCLSEAVAKPLDEAGYPHVFVAKKPDAVSLLACLDVVLGGEANPDQQ